MFWNDRLHRLILVVKTWSKRCFGHTNAKAKLVTLFWPVCLTSDCEEEKGIILVERKSILLNYRRMDRNNTTASFWLMVLQVAK